MSIQVSIVTPEKTTLDQSVESVTVTLLDGEAGILAGHAPMIGRLAPGELRIQDKGKTLRYYVDGGFVQVVNNSVSVLTGHSVPAEMINLAAAKKLLDETIINPSDKEEVVEAKNRTLAQARAQIRIAGG